MSPQSDDTKETMTLATILASGLPPFHTWVRKQARYTSPIIFIEGHLAANPLARYITARLGDPVGQVHLYEGVIYTSCGAQEVPEAFQRFLWHFHEAFAGQHVTAGVLAEWIAQGMPLPYQPDLPDDDRREAEIGLALERAITLVRQGFRDPNQPSSEECLGIALAKYCSWDGPRIARTCLRLCYAALEDANYATMERLLREQFGEETFR